MPLDDDGSRDLLPVVVEIDDADGVAADEMDDVCGGGGDDDEDEGDEDGAAAAAADDDDDELEARRTFTNVFAMNLDL